MNRLVSYAETSSEDEDRCSSHSAECMSNMVEVEQSSEHKDVANLSVACRTTSTTKILGKNKLKMVINHTCNNHGEKKQIQDLPITDESDDQSGDLAYSRNHSQIKLSHSNGETKHVLQETVHFQNKIINENFTQYIPLQKDTNSDEQAAHISIPKNPSVVLNESNTQNISGIPTHSQLFPVATRSVTEAVPRLMPVQAVPESESISRSLVNKKRKFNCDRNDKQLHLPDAIQSMFHDRQQRWVDNPSQHGNKIRSFAHLEGNWATHIYIPVPKSEPFVKFVGNLLNLLMPQTSQVMPDFHISLSRTVPIRYHWIEPLIDSLRDNLKCLKSCISDLTSVKLFTNDEKTRTFVSIELCQDDSEFLGYVKAVDKSFAEFKLPAYYENPSFHISVGWCLGDAVERISDDKLSEAQEMLGEFVAANPDLSFVYVHQISCLSGCRSFVITLQDSNT